MAAFVVLFASGSVRATEYFVDCNQLDDTGDGLTEATAKQTLQAAVDLTKSGDVVTVLPGVYDQGSYSYDSGNGIVSKSRVYIGHALTLRSRDGAEKTHIVGQLDDGPDNFHGAGPNAIRCVGGYDGSLNGTPIRVEGFTLRDGATRIDKDGSAYLDIYANRGGAVVGQQAALGSGYTNTVIVTDCVISNCAAVWGGGLAHCTAVRTRIHDCWAASNGSSARTCRLYNCILTGHSNHTYPVQNVNCTVFPHKECEWVLMQNGVSSCNALFDGYYRFGLPTSCDYTNCFVRCESSDQIITGPGNITDVFEGQSISPAEGDFRLRKNAAVRGRGSLAALQEIPEEFRGTDFYGNPRLTDGTVSIGAVETVGNDIAGFEVTPPEEGTVYLNGEPVRAWCPRYYREHLAPEKLTYAAPDGKMLHHYSVDGDKSRPVLPTLDEVAYITPFLGGFNTIAPVFGEVSYVDIAAAAEGANGSSEHPYVSIQDALDALPTKSPKVVLVAKGDYKTGKRSYAGSEISNFRAVVHKDVYVRLRSVSGAAQTVIRGEADQGVSRTAAPFGCGLNAVGCVAALTDNVFIQGFTLTDGYTTYYDNPSGSPDSSKSGAGFFTDRKSSNVMCPVVVDCVFSNNTSRTGAAILQGVSERCYFGDNRSASYGSVRQGDTVFSVRRIDSGDLDSNAFGMNLAAYNCTVFGVKGTSSSRTDSYLRNCIYQGAKAIGTTHLVSLLYWDFTTDVSSCDEGGSYMKADPQFVDAENGDYRLAASSPALTTGDAAQRYSLSVTGFDGKPLRCRDDGTMPCGAIGTTVRSVEASAVNSDGLEPSGVLRPDGDITFTATDERLYFIGFETNGVAIPVEETGRTFVYRFATAPDAFALRAIYSNVWYVDAVGGDDETGDGWTPKTAFKTLAKALTKPRAGEFVEAAPGTYAEKATTADGESIPNRALVPEGVTLRSRDGWRTTVIQGYYDESSEEAFHLGPDSVRCVRLMSNAVVEGFTIRGGATASNKITVDDDTRGGGVLANSGGKSVDCYFTDNRANGGAAQNAGSTYGCLFEDNLAVNFGGALRSSSAYGCYFGDGNYVGGLKRNVYPFDYCYNIVGCTFKGSVRNGQSNCRLYNCVLLGNTTYKGTAQPHDVGYVYNCAYDPASNAFSRAEFVNENPVTAGLLFADDWGRPAFGSAVIGAAGDYSQMDNVPEVDPDGLPHGLNDNGPDIGCWAYDWRTRYAEDLCDKPARFAVTDVTKKAFETAERNVLIRDGAMSVDWTSRKATLATLNFQVTGTGTLTVTLNGETVGAFTAADGVRAERVHLAGGVNRLVYAYEPGANETGGALVKTQKADPIGCILVIQ